MESRCRIHRRVLEVSADPLRDLLEVVYAWHAYGGPPINSTLSKAMRRWVDAGRPGLEVWLFIGDVARFADEDLERVVTAIDAHGRFAFDGGNVFYKPGGVVLVRRHEEAQERPALPTLPEVAPDLSAGDYGVLRAWAGRAAAGHPKNAEIVRAVCLLLALPEPGDDLVGPYADLRRAVNEMIRGSERSRESGRTTILAMLERGEL